MNASLSEVYIAPDAEVTASETEAIQLIIDTYSNELNELRVSSSKTNTTTNECLTAVAHWLSLLEPLRSTHYFLAEALEERNDVTDLLIHSSEVQQACKSVLAQMFLIACNIYRLEDNLDKNPELIDHMVSIMNRKFEEAGLMEDTVQLELFA
jgi:hypothetical protein